MSDILTRILATKAGKSRLPRMLALSRKPSAPHAPATPPRDFAEALKAKLAAGESAVIAEIKKASPSKGILRA
jgi:indole-3-glycerol phosphate synthase